MSVPTLSTGGDNIYGGATPNYASAVTDSSRHDGEDVGDDEQPDVGIEISGFSEGHFFQEVGLPTSVEHCLSVFESDYALPPFDQSLALRNRGDQNMDSHCDIAVKIKGMYRILDLINEQGSGGLVEKIIIAQESVKDLMNTLSPGAYASLTRVDFKALDKILMKPMGVYGSKSELTRFLKFIGAVEDNLAQELLVPANGANGKTQALRSGIYVVRTLVPAHEERLYVMYLTKLTDQILVFVSSEHSRGFVWPSDEDVETSDMGEDDADDGFFTFEVEKTVEQEEAACAKRGFTISLPSISLPERSPDGILSDESVFFPKLLEGETVQGFMTAKLIRGTSNVDPITVEKPTARFKLRSYLNADVLHLPENLNDAELKTLLDCGLATKFAPLEREWSVEKDAIQKKYAMQLEEKNMALNVQLDAQAQEIGADLFELIVSTVCQTFPMLDRSRLLPKDWAANERQPDSKLADLRRMLPAVDKEVHEKLTNQALSKVSGSAFRKLKEDFFREERMLRNPEENLQQAGLFDRVVNCMTTPFYSDIGSYAKNTPSDTKDADFFALLAARRVSSSELDALAAKALEMAHTSLADSIKLIHTRAFQSVRATQKEELEKRILLDVRHEQDKELAMGRANLVRHINETMQKTGKQSLRINSMSLRNRAFGRDEYGKDLTAAAL
ncbi:hypothetical protein K488DRAFT_68324 [Vararia minispora EC-137]|uniref:Uncharacterized protein n=1 Tax=Vararia minispora EC-137 TaxID=1314806 RepID=A0ACB8QVP6_9AGAM|nr:hypothetical protein K488DRAFT_68324 [Vararia minispora EC-137]